MTSGRITWKVVAAGLATGLAMPACAGMQWGRPLDEKRDVRVGLSVGQFSDMRLGVEETRRQFYDVTDQSFKNDTAESYELSDFDLDDSYVSLGMLYENQARFWTFRFGMNLMNPSTDTTARRNYYIGIGKEVDYQGRSYERMQIPAGAPVSLDVFGGTFEFRGLLTPFSITPSPSVAIIPWIDFSVIGFAGHYEIDAGDPRGVVTYQFPPEEFVVGGRSEGFVGLGMPGIGLGGTLRLGAPDRPHVEISGHYSLLEYDGSSSYFTTADHRDKNLDIDHSDYRVRITFERPRENGKALFIGMQHEVWDSHAEITTEERPRDEVIARRERFDKVVDFEINATTLIAGCTF